MRGTARIPGGEGTGQLASRQPSQHAPGPTSSGGDHMYAFIRSLGSAGSAGSVDAAPAAPAAASLKRYDRDSVFCSLAIGSKVRRVPVRRARGITVRQGQSSAATCLRRSGLTSNHSLKTAPARTTWYSSKSYSSRSSASAVVCTSRRLCLCVLAPHRRRWTWLAALPGLLK